MKTKTRWQATAAKRLTKIIRDLEHKLNKMVEFAERCGKHTKARAGFMERADRVREELRQYE